MKTHTSRWVEVERYRRWELRERAQDGGKVLARIGWRGDGIYFWHIDAWFEQVSSLYAAQRAVRKMLRDLAAAAGVAAARGGRTRWNVKL